MKNIFFAIGTIILLAFLWPYLPFHAAYTVTVTGSAQGEVVNQMATFSATVTSSNQDKQTAVTKVNTQMNALITSLKNFGIPEADIKTEQISTYLQPTTLPQAVGANGTTMMIYPAPPVATGNGDWQASNSITITLRDITKASALSDLLNNSGATNVYGPNFATDPNNTNDNDLLNKAMADAKTKAENMAKAGGQKVGRIVSVQEGGSYPMPMYANAKALDVASSTPTQPGTTTNYKSVTVTWELR